MTRSVPAGKLWRVSVLVLVCAAAVVSGCGILYEFGGNATFHRRLNTSLFAPDELIAESAYDHLVSGDSQGALELFELALRRNPASPYRWSDLAEALVAAGQPERARYSIARAIEAGPHFPQIRMRAANLFFRLEATDRALAEAARVLDLVGDYDEAIFTTYDRMGVPIKDVLSHGIPHRRRPAQAYLRYLMGNRELAELGPAWDWASACGFADDALADQYVGLLVRERQHDAAARVWSAQVAGRERDYRTSNLLYNGSLEREPAGTVFDWRIDPVEAVSVEADRAIAHSGATSLRLTFTGKRNIAYHHISQRVVVNPGRLLFCAFVRSSELTTDEGLRFRIADAEDAARFDVSTGQIRGSRDWTELAASFVVPTGTRLLSVEVTRRLSERFDSKIRGTAWIDDVSLASPR